MCKRSYRGKQYRYLAHQCGVIGYVKVKLLEAADLKRRDWSLLSKGHQLSPYMEFSVGSKVRGAGRRKRMEAEMDKNGMDGRYNRRCCFSLCFSLSLSLSFSLTLPNRIANQLPTPNSQRAQRRSSSVVKNTNNPCWKKESFSIPLRKGEFKDGMPVVLSVKAHESQSVMEAVLPTAVKGDKSLGEGGVDITDLCTGKSDIIDTWINLDTCGQVHVLVGYEPRGIDPTLGDIVCMEMFVRRKSSLVLDPLAPMKVRRMYGGVPDQNERHRVRVVCLAFASLSILLAQLPSPAHNQTPRNHHHHAGASRERELPARAVQDAKRSVRGRKDTPKHSFCH